MTGDVRLDVEGSRLDVDGSGLDVDSSGLNVEGSGLDVEGSDDERLKEVARGQRRHEHVDDATQRSVAPDRQQYQQVAHDASQ